MSRRARTIVLTGVALTLLAGAGVWVVLRKNAQPRELVETRVGDARLIYPPAYARFGGGRNGGHLDSLDLAATFPDLRPAGDASTPLAEAEGEKGLPALVFLTLGRADRKVEPADLVATLYARFLEADIVESDEGLLKRSFQDGSPYTGEDLYFAPPEGRAFAARCARPTIPSDGLPETCIAGFREGGVDIDIRFSRKLLPQWEKLIERMRALTISFLAR